MSLDLDILSALLILELLGAETGELEASFAKTAGGKFGGRAGPNALSCWLSDVLGLGCATVGKKCHGNPRHQHGQPVESLSILTAD